MNEDSGRTKSWGGYDLNPKAPANPCGLIAKSVFNDTFILQYNDEIIKISDKNIAWPSDK